jgi:hypothetical protein
MQTLKEEPPSLLQRFETRRSERNIGIEAHQRKIDELRKQLRECEFALKTALEEAREEEHLDNLEWRKIIFVGGPLALMSLKGSYHKSNTLRQYLREHDY